MVARGVATSWVLAGLLVGLCAPVARGAGEAPRGTVAAPRGVDVFHEPSESGFALATMPLGASVTPTRRGEVADGWLAVEPPEGSFDWVDGAAIGEASADGWAEVVAPRASVRFGVDEARLPGPPARSMARGDRVRLVGRPALVTGEGPRSRIWRAIEPPEGEVRHVRAAGVKLEPAAGATPAADPPVERRASFEAGDPFDPSVPAEFAAELASTDALRRSVVAGPVDRWDLETVRARYRAVLDRIGPDGPGSAAVKARLDEVARDARLADSARRFDRAFQSSARRDAQYAFNRQGLAEARTRSDRAYDARGMLQASSRRHDGQRVHALIGPEGKPIAYLAIPPGIPASRLLARKVGVRGEVHFDEDLGARLISVRDLDPLDHPR